MPSPPRNRSVRLSRSASACAILLVACVASPRAPRSASAQEGSVAPSASMPARIERYAADRNALARFYPVGASPARAERLSQVARDELAALSEVDFDALGLGDKVDHVLLRGELEHELATLADERARLERLADLLPFVDDVVALDDARRRVDPMDAEGAAATLDALADEIEALRERVAKAGGADEDDATEAEDAEAAPAPEVTPVDALWLSGRVGGVKRALAEWHRHYADYLPGFAWWCDEPYGRVRDGLDAYAKLLREEIAGQKGEDDDPMVGDPIGRDALDRDLEHERIAYGPEELLAIGERELAWCEAEMRRAAADLGLGDDWRAALELVKEAYVPPGEQDALVADLAREMIAWLDERELVTIPDLCRETWRVRMIPKDDQRFFPFAFYGGDEVGVAYPTADMAHEAKLMAMRGNNRAFTRCVTPHELVPGHHLQGFFARRFATHRREFSTPFLVEGWALYWEMRQWDLGWASTPEERIGMLFWRMHRAARIVVSLSFHLGEMTPDEMVELLVARVGHESDNAKAEVRRYIGGSYGPLYQCAYMIGGLQLLALHREIVQAGRMDEREFHDAILRCGPIPVETVRALLLGEAPAQDGGATWRFDG